jgi:hypothetical protein
MQSRVLQRLAVAGLIVFGAGASVVATAAARPVRPGPRATSAFNLFAGAVNLRLAGNRVDCNLTNFGNICVNPYGSGTIEGGFWPAGTGDAYVFNGGLQLAGTVQYPGGAAGPWANDTVGVFFMDPQGPQRMGEGITNVYSGQNANDLAVWPSAAYIQDTSLYNKALIGQKTISQQDTWVRYWDGNPNVGAGRKHTMGVLVEQRGLLWNTAGQEDVLYFLIRFINITATDPAAYAGLADAGYTPAQISDIVAVGQAFHDKVQATFGVNLPAGGYTFHNTFAAFMQDPDLGIQNDHNYSSAILPFALTAVMKTNYSEPDWTYPASLFSAPFQAAPGYQAVKYLKSPTNPATGQPYGITVWGNTSRAGQGVPDATGIWQMYRYLSGTNSPAAGDVACNAKEPPAISHTCSAVQAFADTRFYMASGPFDLEAGHSSVIVVGMIFAAPLGSMPATTNGIYSLPAFSLNTFVAPQTVDQTFFPLWPAQPESLAVYGSFAPDLTPYVRPPIERPMGWGQYSDVNGNGRIDQDEVSTPLGSLLSKAKVAQLIFDGKFLSPFAPTAPEFYLVPGDGQVSVMWKQASTETDGIGDPYFAVAGDVTSALYDPNYRQFDVEGYRVYRGRTKSQMVLLAQFDYLGTSILDYTGNVFDPINYTDAQFSGAGAYQCAPELGITATCPQNGFPFAEPLVSNVIQIRPGGRQALANGNVIISLADTAVTGNNTQFPPLRDNLVPFAYVDNTVRNGVQYFYAVTSFDVNSFISGPTSLESSLVSKSVTPHTSSGQETLGSLGSLQILGGDGTVLNPNAALPTIDAATGIFSGPMPPANGGNLGFLAFVPSVIASGSGAMTLTIDSLMGGDAFVGLGGFVYATVSTPAGSSKLTVPMPYEIANGAADTIVYPFPAQPNNQAKASRFGGDTTFALYGNFTNAHAADYYGGNFGRAAVNGAAGQANGPRWWAGSANENTPNPNGGVERCQVFNLHANGAGCGLGSHMAGVLPGVDSLLYVLSYQTTNSAPIRQVQSHTAAYHRAADFSVYWGAAGVVDSVVDVSNHTKVPFRVRMDGSWGILNDSSFLGIVDSTRTRDGRNSILTLGDITCIAPWPTLGTAAGVNACGGGLTAAAPLMNHARLSPIAAYSATYAGTATQAASGNGFIFYLNGEFFLMQMATLPSNVVWHMRDYVGVVTGDSATATFAFTAKNPRPVVPGMQFKISYQGSVVSPATVDTMFANIHTVPDPYYVTNSLETSPNNKVLLFVNLPSQCIVRIYSASGILIRVLTHNDAGNGSELQWDLRNRNNQFVASGVYFYHVESADGRTKIGRFTVVNFAQ